MPSPLRPITTPGRAVKTVTRARWAYRSITMSATAASFRRARTRSRITRSSFSRSPNSFFSAYQRLFHCLWTAVRNPIGLTFWPKLRLLFLNRPVYFFDGFSSVSVTRM